MEPPTGLIPWFSKTKGNTYDTIAASPFPLQGKPTQAQDVAVRGTFEEHATGLIPWFSKTEGNTYATVLHHPLLCGETNARSRRSTMLLCK